ncbi:hypothetical protein P7B02_08095 [Caulobacter segnis]|uniref:hypothetical protein n=1 Tax=Caulobacter segnis TaxID=88688 RepID=UPI00240F68C9|nr:hypothetical protein [Caulobacter segnis]MDG2521501.1 hypothetical protein [Caulobacter segnis]
MAGRAKQKAPPTPDIPILEWVSAGAGGLMALALLALVLIDARKEHEPPILKIAALETVRTAGGWRVMFEVRNEGGETAAGVHVTGALADGETANAVLDVVPGGSAAEGGLFFKSDPRAGRLALRAEGFVEP